MALVRTSLLAACLFGPGMVRADLAPAPQTWRAVEAVMSQMGGNSRTIGHDPSSIYLVSLFEDGSLINGSGTIIRGEDGISRALTAGHVTSLQRAPEEGGAALSRVYSFSQEGAFLASLFPVVTGFDGLNPPDADHVSPQDVSSDVAVLEVEYFFDEAAEKLWAESGARLAPIQPSHLLSVLPSPDSILANPGISGGAMRNSEGEVVGVISYTHHEGDIRVTAGGTDAIALDDASTDPAVLAAGQGANQIAPEELYLGGPYSVRR